MTETIDGLELTEEERRYRESTLKSIRYFEATKEERLQRLKDRYNRRCSSDPNYLRIETIKSED